MLDYLALFLEVLFFVGLVGSLVVAIMAFVSEDFFQLSRKRQA